MGEFYSKMIRFYIIFSLCCFSIIVSSPLVEKSTGKSRISPDEYWTQRQELLEQDFSTMIGHDIILSEDELIANEILMKAKDLEYDAAFESAHFSPGRNFFLAKDEIDASDVFKIIKTMPKGALLHTHDIAMASIDWVISELTYMPDLYMCRDEEDYLFFKFFDTPDNTCEWMKVSDERSSFPSDQDFDAELKTSLSLHTDDPSVYSDINVVWKEFEKRLIAVGGIFSYREACERYLYRAFEEYHQDGISHIEFRGTLPRLYEKNGTELSELESYQVYEDVINNFVNNNTYSFNSVRFIYAPLRRMSNATMWQVLNIAVDLYNKFPDTCAGFDLVGQEDLGLPLKDFSQQLLNLTNTGIPLFFHAGETTWEGVSTDENIADALLLNTRRIGHGYAITKHPKLKQMAKEKDIPLEVCPISNQVLMLVSDIRNHPATSLIAEDHPIVISSDDPATWEACPLSHDFYEAFMGLGGKKADLRFLKKLAMNSIRYSSLDESEKLKLENLWKSQWTTFIASLNSLSTLSTPLHC